jgi:1-phosphofructokinase family hexose kinase
MILSVCANPSVDSFWSIDQIEKGTTNRSKYERFYPGGKGIHVALGLRELGGKVTAMGVWGGNTGKWIKEKCHSRNISTMGITVEDWTRICITNKTYSNWNETELLGAGPTLKADQVQSFISIYRDYLSNNKVSAVVLSGSVPKGFSNDIYAELTNLAQAFDIPTFIDASGELLKESLNAKPFAVHINADEGKELTNIKEPADIAKQIANNCNLAAVTAGKDGLYLAYEDSLFHASHDIEKSKVISTVGAGDSLLAGLCYSFSSCSDQKEWSKWATACGSANCINPKLGMFDLEDVKQIINEVQIEKLQ